MSASPLLEGRPPQQIAIGVISDAEAYREAALLVEPKEEPLFVKASLVAPAWHLLCHSTELAMKAFLLSHGADPGSRPGGLLHHSLRHNLAALYERAQEKGLTTSSEFEEILASLSPFHEAHIFRYRRPGYISLPTPYVIADALEPVIANIKGVVRQRWMESQGLR